MQRALVLAGRLPQPVRSGGDLRSWQTVLGLRARGEVTVFGLERNGPPPPGFTAADWVSHEMDLGSEGLLDWIREPGGHPSDRWFSEDAAAGLRALLDRARPETVVIESAFLHRYIPMMREHGCAVVLDAHNVEAPLHEELADGRGDLLSRLFAERLRGVEATAFAAVDQIWFCSERDAELAAARYPDGAPGWIVPNTIDVAAYTGPSARADVPTLVYVGTLGYPPNERAAMRLLTEIWPQVQSAVPGARLVLAGADPSAAVEAAAAAAPGDVELTGFFREALPYLRDAWATVIPLREGGGTRLKVLEALAAELPVISTAKGVEGLDLRPGEHYVAAESAEDLAAAAVALLGDTGRRAELAAAGHDLVARDYDLAVSAARIDEALGALAAGEKRKSLT